MKKKSDPKINQEQVLFLITLIIGLGMLKYPVQAFFQGHLYATIFYALAVMMVIPWTRQSIESSFNTKFLSVGYLAVVAMFFALGFVYSIL